MTTSIFDTHSHLVLCEKNIDIKTHLEECEDASVKYVLDPGIDPFDFEERMNKLKEYANVFLGVAIAPHISNTINNSHFDKLESILKKEEVIAISEIGLEYFHLKDNHAQQKKLFDYQLSLAKEYDLPVFLHIREAMSDAIDVVKASKVSKGAVHCFTGNKEDAKKFLDMGFHLSFSGIVTFKNANDIQEAALIAPIDRILTETDSPYLSPTPHRGKPNKSPYIIHTHAFLSQLKSMDREVFDRQIWSNALSFFNMDKKDRNE